MHVSAMNSPSQFRTKSRMSDSWTRMFRNACAMSAPASHVPGPVRTSFCAMALLNSVGIQPASTGIRPLTLFAPPCDKWKMILTSPALPFGTAPRGLTQIESRHAHGIFFPKRTKRPAFISFSTFFCTAELCWTVDSKLHTFRLVTFV